MHLPVLPSPAEEHISGCSDSSAYFTMATNGDKSSFYDDEENLKELCDFLRSREGPAVREALLMEKRVHYFKGRRRKSVTILIPQSMIETKIVFLFCKL
jgi:hypothetical protein